MGPADVRRRDPRFRVTSSRSSFHSAISRSCLDSASVKKEGYSAKSSARDGGAFGLPLTLTNGDGAVRVYFSSWLIGLVALIVVAVVVVALLGRCRKVTKAEVEVCRKWRS